MALATECISHFNETLKTVEEVTPQEFVSRDFGKSTQIYTSFWDPGQEWQERMHVDPWLAAIRGFFLHPRQATGMSIWMCRCDYNMFPRFAALCDVFSCWQSPCLCPCQRYYLVGLCVGISVAVGVTIMYHLPAQNSPIFQLMYLNCDPVIRNLRLKQKNSFVDFDWVGHLTLSSWAKASCRIYRRRAFRFQSRHRCRKQVSVF